MIAEANARKAQATWEPDELREALEILEGKLGSGTQPYDSQDGTWPSWHCVKKTVVTGALLCGHKEDVGKQDEFRM